MTTPSKHARTATGRGLAAGCSACRRALAGRATGAGAGGGQAQGAGTIGPPSRWSRTRALDLLKASSARLAAAKTMSFTAVVNEEYPSRCGRPSLRGALRRDDAAPRQVERAVEWRRAGVGVLHRRQGDDGVCARRPIWWPWRMRRRRIDASLQKAPSTRRRSSTRSPTCCSPTPTRRWRIAQCWRSTSARRARSAARTPRWWPGPTTDVFLQIWIGVDDKLPRRIRAIYRDDPMQFRHEMELSDWRIDGAIPAQALRFGEGAERQEMAFASRHAAATGQAAARKQPALPATGAVTTQQ